jgi:hypothetical protein
MRERFPKTKFIESSSSFFLSLERYEIKRIPKWFDSTALMTAAKTVNTKRNMAIKKVQRKCSSLARSMSKSDAEGLEVWASIRDSGMAIIAY